MAILGSSGAGKTTLFHAINGFAKADSGSIRLNGVEVTGLTGRALRRVRSQIGVVSQRHDLVDSLAVYQNVMAGALGRWSAWRALRFLLRPHKDEMDEAAAALRRVGLEHKLGARTSGISGGEHQRVAIARALVQQPVLLLADEPVASLDPKLSEQILALLCGLAAESRVTLFVLSASAASRRALLRSHRRIARRPDCRRDRSVISAARHLTRWTHCSASSI